MTTAIHQPAAEGIFDRTERLLGSEGVSRLAALRVIIFGVGGVGSWCAESLVRTGVGHVTLVDADRVCVTNLNRQLMATTETIGQPKVEALRERLLTINPAADVVALARQYTTTTAADFALDDYDYVVDAIDSLQDKMELILHATHSRTRLYSSMGAALKLDPGRIAVAEFWKVKGCPLAAALRRKFKKSGRMPSKRFRCVYSDELLPNVGEVGHYDLDPQHAPAALCRRAQTNGSLAHITAIFGFTLAGLIIKDATGREV